MKKFCIAAVTSLVLATGFQATLSAQIVLDFSNVDVQNAFDGAVVGDRIDLSPFNQGNSPKLNHNADTTFIITQINANMGAGNELSASAGQLGVGRASNPNQFDGFSEGFSFQSDVDGNGGNYFKTYFEEFQFNDLDFQFDDGGITITEEFSLTSESFKNNGWENETWGDASNKIVYNEGTGTFTFSVGTSTGATDTWDLKLNGEIVVFVDEVDDVSLTYFSNDGFGFASVGSLTLHAIPEPGTLGLLAACGMGAVFYRRRKSDKGITETAPADETA
ncbi:PEP-CTERM sorting domain-containing protein [Mariniblastus sp.]|nr:PEP-CTERM sorting domain-containing protein [Mariniblastus sp.]MDB4756372.1 PEP-CTERM sorting domain-containing protein [Mariniblastus sp.]